MSTSDPDPRKDLFLIRNILVGVIIVIAAIAIIVTWASRPSSAKEHITREYQRTTALDESGESAYVADGTPSSVAAAISDVEEPVDELDGAGADGTLDGSHFMQYPDYLIALFPYQSGKTKVMVSRDYTSGYNHYHHYVGSHWVSTPRYSGSGSDYRGGGSGSGK
ncbi:protein of unknown function [Gordonia malaquae]|uniref:DUF4247 domain-containing protein n=1 Tax=Gordonia malaquae NBRC 108250 TaxID=1223542 RepID=M3VBM3_GORML|nr:DUF4247 domain-containing protein [Gordonia malaquae]GAC80513.1 hypothetical protein GM1_018_00760 [Gordonia malaquae NBRC 108250]SEE17253.1 protein of unknown function [Gordonia malaquae]